MYVYNLGDNIPAMKRGKFGVVKGSVQALFHPFHVDFEIGGFASEAFLRGGKGF